MTEALTAIKAAEVAETLRAYTEIDAAEGANPEVVRAAFEACNTITALISYVEEMERRVAEGTPSPQAHMNSQIEWLKARLAGLQLPAGKRDHDTREKWLLQCGMPEADAPAPQNHMTAPYGWVGFNSGPTEWFWSETREALEHELSEDIRPATHLEKYLFNKQGNRTHEHDVPSKLEQNEYDRGVRDGIDQALVIAKGQAGMMADLAIDGLPENARNREAMEAALQRFGHTLGVTLEALAPSPQGRLPYEIRLQIGKALDRLVCEDSTPEQVNTFIQTFADFGLRIVANNALNPPPETRALGGDE